MRAERTRAPSAQSSLSLCLSRALSLCLSLARALSLSLSLALSLSLSRVSDPFFIALCRIDGASPPPPFPPSSAGGADLALLLPRLDQLATLLGAGELTHPQAVRVCEHALPSAISGLLGQRGLRAPLADRVNQSLQLMLEAVVAVMQREVRLA